MVVQLSAMGFSMDGFDDFIEDLESLQEDIERVDKMDGEHIPFDELFPQSFMRQYTDAQHIEEFFENGPWNVDTQEDFEAISETELDRYVDQHSRFRTWEQMKDRAGSELMKRRLNW